MRQTLFRTAPLLLALTLPLVGCNGENPFGIVVDDGGDFTMQVLTDDGTVYTWETGQAQSLAVLRASDSFQVWRLDALSGGDGFSAPVQHGIVPSGAGETQDATILETGVQYRVELTLTDGRTARESFVR